MMHDPDVSLIVSHLSTINSSISQLREDVTNQIDSLKKDFKQHEEKDSEYWKRVDKRDTQLILLKGLTLSSFGLWVLTWFAEQFGIKVRQ